ncbi:unnamed protein product [Adineta steineri]|uniref:Uncharacterized protein n=1 Tax=Adineta steineri TaxID=433720 RepID=A0A819TLX1_9BILA|nr:unnamed protein product [Adineta steineri]
MDRFRANLKAACMSKIESETWFSEKLAKYIRHLASYYQVDLHAMVLAVVNVVADTCGSTYVNRASHFLVPCNLYNLIVGRSETGTEISLDQTDSLTTTSITSTASATNKHVTTTNNNTISNVIFNDGTSAGILNGLKKCTRAMHLHEADVTLKTLGVILPSPSDITPTRIDPFRTILMTIYEKPGQFLRILKKETVDVSGSKLNIFGASTGDLIAAELVRQAASLPADQLFERFIFWPVDGEPIRNDQCITSIDFYQYCSLEQISIFCGFFADLILNIKLDGKSILADQAFEFRVAGKESADETDIKLPVCNLLYKNPEVRIAAFCGLLEAAFDMVPIYIDQFVSFHNGEVNDWFFERCSKIAENMYGLVLRKDERFVISTEICKRSQKVNVQNLAQYLSLMKISDEDKKKWMHSCGKNIRSCIEFSTIDGNKLPETTDISSKPELALSRKQENMLKKPIIIWLLSCFILLWCF